ncbi:MAG: hypothetical protein ABSA49_02125 [Rhizomicrobium sp.]|jgi:hypothetical protein
MSAGDILAWHDFFAVVAQIGATLAGLLFVGLTISLEHLLQARGYLSRAFAALFLQFEILLIGLFGLVPAQPQWAFGIELIVLGAALFAAIETFSRNFPEDDQSDVLGTKPLRILREILNAASTLLPVAAGATLIAGWRGALYLLIPAIVACVYMSIGYAWVFAVEIPRRREVAKKVDRQDS